MFQGKANTFFAKLHEYLTYAFFFIIPLPDRFLTIGLGLWCGSWLLWRVSHYKERYPISKSAKIGLILFASYNLINYASAFWGHTPALAGRLMEHRLSMWILTIVLLFGFPPFIKFTKSVKSFLIGNLTMVIIYTARLIVMYISDGETRLHMNIEGFDSFFQGLKHPSYFSLNLILSFFLYQNIRSARGWRRILSDSLMYATFGIMIYISGSRAGLLSFALLSIYFGVFFARHYLSVKQMLIIAFPLLIIFGTGVITSQKFHVMFDDSEHVSVRAPRKILWKSGANMLMEKPLLGYGLGSSKVDFIEKSKEKGLYLAYEKEYNVHNQFLETSLESGVVSLILFILAFVFFARDVDRKSRYMAYVVMLIFGFALFFESMLLRIAAVSTFLGLVLLIFSLSQSRELTFDKRKSKISLLVYATFVLLILTLGVGVHSKSLTIDSTNSKSYAYKDYILVSKSELPLPLPERLSNLEFDAARYDNTSEPSLWSGNAHLINKVAEHKLKAGEQLTFSTYCYVSEDFDGAWVKISIDNKTGKPSLVQDHYDLEKKNTWQNLEVKVDDETGPMPAHFFFARYNCNSFDDLKGYVLFAYPQYIITKK